MLQKMGSSLKVALVTGALSRRGAGVSATIEDLSRHLNAQSVAVRVFGLDCPDWRAGDALRWNGANACVHSVIGPNILGYAPNMSRALFAWQPDLVHTHGLWLLTSRSVRRWSQVTGNPYLISIHGMLSPSALRYARIKKSVAMSLYQARVLDEAMCLHATSEEEYRDIRRFGLTNPVAIVPHGIELPSPIKNNTPRNAPMTVLSLGRLHPIKGLDSLIRAWSRIEPEFPDWRLMIAGPDDCGHADELRSVVSKLRVRNVEISGPVFGSEKLELMRYSELFVLSSLNENFALTVAESLSAGTPVISTNGAPWSGLNVHCCGWWIEQGPEPMAAALRHAMSLSIDDRRALGDRGRAWMERDFSWDVVALKMTQVYRWLANGAERPACVRLAG